MRRAPRGTKAVAALMGVALALAACGSSKNSGAGSTTTGANTTAANSSTSAGETTTAPPETTAAAPPGGDVAYAQEEEGLKYNNLESSASNFANTVILNVIQPGPFIQDDKLSYNLWTDMMESAEVTNKSPETLTYKIKAAAIWEDGQPIDCKDFYLAYGAQSGKATRPNPDWKEGAVDANGDPVPKTLSDFTPAGTTGYDQIKSLTCSDDKKTVTVVFDTLYADWKGLFGTLMPAHILEAKTGIADIMKVDLNTDSPDTQKAGKFWNEGWANWDPSVALSGAWYRIKSYTAGTGITLVRNEKFWGKPGNLDTLIFRTINDPTAEAQALQNGELQAIVPQADPAVADNLSKATGIKFAPQAGLVFEHLDLNMKLPIFQDLAVRQAFALCMDRADIVGKLVAPVNPNEKPMDQVIFIPEAKGYTPHLSDAGFGKMDIARSKSLLEGAGWALGGDGIYAKAGKKLTFRISHKGIPRRSQTVQLIIASCKQAGFDIKEDGDKKFNAVRLPLGDYDVALFAWVGTPLLSSPTSIYVPDGGQNYQKYVNPKIKDLFDQANGEFDDAKRIDLMNQIDKTIIDDMVSIPLFQLPELLAYTEKLSNVKYNGPLGITWNANEWVLSA